MEKIAFIGGYDKTDFIFYIAKLLKTLGNKVMIVDGTVSQKARYIIPTLTPTMTYITENDGIDFAIGFDSMNTLRGYLDDETISSYNYILFDVDSRKRYKGYEFEPKDRHYVATSFDVYSLRKAAEVLKGIEMETEITRIYFSKAKSDEEDNYFKYLVKDTSVNIKKELIHIPLDINDIEAIHKNQRDNILRYNVLSAKYVQAVIYVTSEISEESASNVKRAIKKIGR